ncbi:CO(2)-response secreted protease-like [Tasmannia lanceolata]|uniref:CO(2)-response secreted protease-like n=1 Tax=Tasmannia lanceolata TaxID=3420 RepID=UPI004063DE96
MKGFFTISFLIFSIFLLLFLLQIEGGNEGERNVYVVYMGAASTGREDHVQLLASVLEREEEHAKKTLIHSYTHGFSGFAAQLTDKEALTMSQKPGVVSVFVDPVLQLHTTRSWDFLQYQTELETNSEPGSNSDSLSQVDTIIGLLDTGVWPESESFNDQGMGDIPARWKGVCKEGQDFNASNCNRKLIGARYYNSSISAPIVKPQDQTARDSNGHGTHTASTAAGSSVPDASYYGLAGGTAKGGSPTSRLAIYRVCTLEGCRGSAILAAFDDAMADGVDVLSLSLGASAYRRLDYKSDPIAIGAFHAIEKGIIVVCSAGNDGPDTETVVNAAPWIMTVGATTIDRDFESDVVLGENNTMVKGEAINFSNLGKSPVNPLIYSGSAKSNSSSDDDSRNCFPDTLDGDKIKGKIVLCEHSDTTYSQRDKMEEVTSLGGIGMVLVDDLEQFVAFSYGIFPMTVISSEGATKIRSYINSTRNPVATVLPTISVTKYKPAPAVAYFSSRGPSFQTRNILKPDIAAPGVNILAAFIPRNDSSAVPPGQKPSQFNLLSGTSMACPHVSGIAASVKSTNPTFSPSAIRSAIMTTAIQTNNERGPLTEDSGSTATPYDYGAGEVSPTGALQPGLVYETETDDYLLFLCNYGYTVETIKLISSVPNAFDCPKESSTDLISDLNYPSISISKFDGKNSKGVNRTVTNVGAEDETTYIATVKSPPELDVKVIPDQLQFTKNSKKLSYQVIFSLASSSSVKADLFGSITWANGKHRVRTPFVVSSD